MNLVKRCKVILRNPYNMAYYAGGIQLRDYQIEPINAIWESIRTHAGRTFVIMCSRQSGKDELLAHLKLFLLMRYSSQSVEIVEFNPTYKPQTIRAIMRLENRMDTNVLTRGRWSKRSDFMRMIGACKVSFLSGDGSANVVGATASLLLIINEAQDISPAIYDKKAAPMAASTNATRVIVGTAWTSTTLLARELRAARAAEADGIRRVFIYDAVRVAQVNPDYGTFVAGEISRLGRNHPFVRTQYFNEEIDAQVGMFHAGRLALMQADQKPHISRHQKTTYAFLIDVAGQDEALSDPDNENTILANPGRDSTTLSIVTIDSSSIPILQAPTYRVVHRMTWTGTDHVSLFGQLKSLISTWKPLKIVIDASGVGEGLWSMLDKAAPGRVIPVKFSQQEKSEIGWRFLAIIETGRFHDCEPSDHVTEQYISCQSEILPGPSKTLRWGVPEGHRSPTGELIHDDYVLADALTAVLDRLQWSAQLNTLVLQSTVNPIKESL